ncbi:MAG: hypothetical protein R3B84_20385 [Zavarzinella sp.]
MLHFIPLLIGVAAKAAAPKVASYFQNRASSKPDFRYVPIQGTDVVGIEPSMVHQFAAEYGHLYVGLRDLEEQLQIAPEQFKDPEGLWEWAQGLRRKYRSLAIFLRK